MNKLYKIIFLVLLLVFSMYYTDKSINLLRELDPIMTEIKDSSKNYKIKSINAKIDNDNIISGLSGVDIDYKKSYSKMKQYGTYNESLTTLVKVKPTISIEDNYDKFVVGGNPNNKYISFIFIINNTDNINSLLKIISNKNIDVTFFINGNLIEDNVSLIKEISKNYYIGVYYDKYDKDILLSSISYMNTITNNKTNYCFCDRDNYELLNICSSNKMHTIKTNYLINNNLYDYVKNNLSNSTIIGININKNIISELSSTIDYVKSRGFKLLSVNKLIKE